jgi:hypothetical protein
MRSPAAQRPDASWGPDASWVKRIIALVLENPGDAVYGAIAVGALLAAETPRQETYAKTIAAVIITLVLYWLAHSYADLAGERLRSGGRLTAQALLATMLRELPILIGAAIPLVTLLLCWIVGTGLSAAVLAAVWTSAGIIAQVAQRVLDRDWLGGVLKPGGCDHRGESLDQAAHRVDQVEGRVDLAAGAAERLGAQDIPLVQFESVVLERARPAPAAARSRTRHRTSCPDAARVRARRPPMNPVAPVTSTR